MEYLFFWVFCTYCLASSSFVSIQALAKGDGCSSCPLTYAPVVDEGTGLPFYNDCVAKCQLGPGAKLIAAGSRRGGSAAAGRRRASEVSEPDFMKLVPAPTVEGSKDGGVATSDTMLRFIQQGYLYVGRPGFIEKPNAEEIIEQNSAMHGNAHNNVAIAAATETTATAAYPANVNQAGDDSGGPMVSLRMVYPDGHMYMKVWNQNELKSLVKKHTGPKSDSARLSRARVPADVTDNNGNVKASPIQAAISTPSRHSAHHRLLRANKALDDRREVASPSYPYTAVSFLSTNCSGAFIGPTNRLVLTAAQCLFGYNHTTNQTVGWYPNISVAPSVHSSNAPPFGWIPTETAEVQMKWQQAGYWGANIGILQLSYHNDLPGALAFGFRCTPLTYSLTTAGYPSDKPAGTMWMQSTNATTDMCSGEEEKIFSFDAADGQVGSAFWDSENSVRFVLSRGSCCNKFGGAVAITPAYYSWIAEFTETRIKNPSTKYILVGGVNRDQYIRCDIKSLRCLGTKIPSSGTNFYAYPVYNSSKYALRVPDTALCLSLLRMDNTSALYVGLYKCNVDTFTFAPYNLWNFVTWENISVARTDSGYYMWWAGDNKQPTVVQTCTSSPSQCTWSLNKISPLAKKYP
ncbi:hypothetical protein Vretimale_8600 [Volvox reticuliferus]|uniref:Peptidase S1 domain-containing protein n=1 Tax=Volvox reticuliferus TaxID=1737510 RepID=A0A8J4C7D0_9CHLO|nr:hypothetical protein Vretifemale_6494 [Volvox reticuliferus]GIM03940.1 hypothetical protein Vretimale_8600 [Volvox reticuliferus]